MSVIVQDIFPKYSQKVFPKLQGVGTAKWICNTIMHSRGRVGVARPVSPYMYRGSPRRRIHVKQYSKVIVFSIGYFL